MKIRHIGPALLIAALTMAAFATSVRPAGADEHPTRPIHLIVPFPPGAGSGRVARRVARAMANTPPQPIVVENKERRGRRSGQSLRRNISARGGHIAADD